jgi:hypothetical protein
MTRYGYIGLICGLSLTMAPGGALAQPAVAPASSIRVIEFVDPYSGERNRRVAEDLTPAEIARVQHALAAAGFDAGRATGLWNATTRHELGRFQASRGLTQCECLTYESLVALGIHPDVVASVRAPVDAAYGSRTVVLLPERRGHFGSSHGTGIVVGHGPSVFVGHQPARGANEFGRTHVGQRPPRYRDRGHDGDGGRHLDPRPPRPRPGGSGSRSGAPLRPLAPRQTKP